MIYDNQPMLLAPPMSPTLGTRLISYWVEIGLSQTQLQQAISISKSWRELYVYQLGPTLNILGKSIDDAMNVHNPDLNDIFNKIDTFTDTLQSNFANYTSAVAALSNLIDDSQDLILTSKYQTEKNTGLLRLSGLI